MEVRLRDARDYDPVTGSRVFVAKQLESAEICYEVWGEHIDLKLTVSSTIVMIHTALGPASAAEQKSS